MQAIVHRVDVRQPGAGHADGSGLDLQGREEKRVRGSFGGKIECGESLIAPFKEGQPHVALPGMGDRVSSLTQDDEMAFAQPARALPEFLEGLKEAAEKAGVQYPVLFYLNFEPQLPKPFMAVGKVIGLFGCEDEPAQNTGPSPAGGMVSPAAARLF